jgi:uncharacterized repeat protein (TIGR01451 family)
MRPTRSVLQALGHLVAAWLACIALLCGAVPVLAQSIRNVANAGWRTHGITYSAVSNVVTFDVVQKPVVIETYRPSQQGAALDFRVPDCGGHPLASPLPGGTGALEHLTASRTDSVASGEEVAFRIAAPVLNRDPAAIEHASLLVTTGSGDRETIEIYETAPDSGVFQGGFRTTSAQGRPIVGDCRIGVTNHDTIRVDFQVAAGVTPLATTVINVLADPYGLIFDSQDGSLVNGARVSIVDAATGAPARVFAEDGVTPYPDTLISGTQTVDAAGHVHPLEVGEYRFPLVAQGDYRIVVEPPAPYVAPSAATQVQVADLLRPDGRPFLLGPASFGAPLRVAGTEAVRVDIPVDGRHVALALTKTASRATAMPGDIVFYTIVVANPDTVHARRRVVLEDASSGSLRLRLNTVMIDRKPVSAAAFAPRADGSGMVVQLGDMAPGAQVTVTYAMTVRADATPGQAVNRATARDILGNASIASATVRLTRETLADRMTVSGQVTSSGGSGEGRGVPGVRVMLEDGSFAVTDADGRYHFEGLIPGTHVVAIATASLPGGATAGPCAQSTRSAGNCATRFVEGQGGSLARADFVVGLPQGQRTTAIKKAELSSGVAAAGGDINWIASGDGPIDFLFPAIDHNPRAPAVRVVIRHRAGQSVELRVDGKAVDAVAYDGAEVAPGGAYAISIWRGIPLDGETTALAAIVRNADGSVAAQLARDVHFNASPARVEFLPAQSRLIADGETRPVLAVRVLDHAGRPVHAGIGGDFTISAPYESASAIEAQRSRSLVGLGGVAPRWTVLGDNGVALIELAPTMVSGPLRLDFTLGDAQVRRKQVLESWVEPGTQKWTLVGLAEGALGSRSIADAMERAKGFDSDLGTHARIAFYAKGRILGRTLLTVAYDSAKQRAEQRLFGVIDPDTYYTVFGDGSERRHDAASRKRLYLRIESRAFYALFGDIQTGFEQTQLTRYQRAMTGVKGEVRTGGLHVQGFTARSVTSHRRDEFQGGGITGPYRLSSRDMVAGSEQVAIEVRDRFRSEVIVERRALTRFVDYDIDLASATVTFKTPVLSRDPDLNPQIVVVDYERLSSGESGTNAGLRADWTRADGAIRVGATAISDIEDGRRTEVAGLDLRLRKGTTMELRAEVAANRRNGQTALGWLIEAERHDGRLDILAYARSADPEFGLSQLSGAERGRRKIGYDMRYLLDDGWSVTGSGWMDDSLTGDARRTAVQVRSDLRRGQSDSHVALSSFSDKLADGTHTSSTVAEAGASRRMFDSRLELEASTALALGRTGSVDLPQRHRFSARYAIVPGVRLAGTYEIARGEAIDARTARVAVEASPWTGGRLSGGLGRQVVAGDGARSFAAFGLAQTIAIGPHLSLDGTVDANHLLGSPRATAAVNPAHPLASGGALGTNGTIAEDFTALTLGGIWHLDRWTTTMRGEWRRGEYETRKGINFGAIRQISEGRVLGAQGRWSQARAATGATSATVDGALSAAWRPDRSDFAFLARAEYRSDAVTDALAGVAGPAGSGLFTVTGDARSRRVIASMSSNWSPSGRGDDRSAQRTEIGLFTAVRHNFDSYQGFDLAGTSLFAGLDARFGIGPRVEIGAGMTLRSALADHVTSFAIGPHLGFSPARDTLLTIGYNITGFRDRDFADARSTRKGVFVTLRFKFDAEMLGLAGY